LITNTETTRVLTVDQAKGSVHDFRLYKNRTGSAIAPDIQAKTDSGYQGIKDYHANSEVPYKKSKNRPLSAEEKAFNRQLARQRVVIEHINRQIKVFKIMAERYRNRRKRHKLRMILICAIRNYEIELEMG
jgi:hypothetical protein